jgi:hypothetical protein
MMSSLKNPLMHSRNSWINGKKVKDFEKHCQKDPILEFWVIHSESIKLIKNGHIIIFPSGQVNHKPAGKILRHKNYSSFEEIKRVLNPKGELFCSFEAKEQEQQKKPTIITRKAYSKSEIEQFFSDINFSITSIEKLFGYQSPTTGDSINYFYVIAQNTTLMP